jgi:hypothetical protein
MSRSRIIAAFVTLVLLAVLTSHRGWLGYFSPHSLEYRVQTERTLFSTGIPIYRSFSHPVDNPLVDMLVAEKFVTPQAKEDGRWECVYHHNDAWRDGHGPLYNALHQRREELIEWSLAHRDCAAIYWTEVFRLLRSDKENDHEMAYEILDLGGRISEVSEMKEMIDKVRTMYGSPSP